jgi:UDP-glucuronate decarboxylase
MRNRIVESDLQFITAADLPWNLLRGKTVLVSGAAGFLPAYMVETLLFLNETRQCDIRVVGLVRNLERARERFRDYRETDGLRLICQDVCEKVRLDEEVHYIIHAASQATPKVYSRDPVGTILPNVIGTNNLLELAAEKRAEAFLYFSTSGVYGHVAADQYPVKENTFGYLDSMDLASCYLESKRMGENLCVAWNHQFGVPVKIVRPAITYGPGIKLDDGRSFADFIANVVRCQDIELYSDGKVIRNFCYVADAMVGFFMVLLKGRLREAYNIATDQEITIYDLAKLLVEKVFPERKLKVVLKHVESKNYLRIEFPRTTVDISKAKALGWTLHFPVEAGFKRTVESFQERH